MSSGKPEIDTVLADLQDVFDKPQQNLKACKLIECRIDTADARPIRQRAYRTALSKRKEISRQVDDMLAQGIILSSMSPWASPIILVPKKSGELRFCVDYRAINAVTIKDSFPLPLIQDRFRWLRLTFLRRPLSATKVSLNLCVCPLAYAMHPEFSREQWNAYSTDWLAKYVSSTLMMWLYSVKRKRSMLQIYALFC